MKTSPPAPARLSQVLGACAIAAGLVLLGHLVAAQPNEHLGWDSTYYGEMVKGNAATVPAPFSSRVAVPFLASLLPLAPGRALLVISYLGLFGTYLLVMHACATIGLSFGEAVFGLVAIWGGTWHLYHYYNPFLTDGVCLFVLSVMMHAVLNGGFVVFAAAALIGLLVRETPLALVPAWFVRRETVRTVLLLVACLIVLWLLRHGLTDDGARSFGPASNGSEIEDQPVDQPLAYLRQLQSVWGLVWWLPIAGCWHLPRPFGFRLATMYAALFLGGLAASTIATDMGRMFGFLAPVLAIGCAQLYAVLRREHAVLAWTLVVAVVVQGIFNAPKVMLEDQAWLAGWPRRVFLLSELLLGIAILTRLYQQVKRDENPVRVR